MNEIALTLILAIPVSVDNQSKDSGDKVYSTSAGAIEGYDPVAYFKLNKAMKGKEAYSCNWKEATWYFTSKENSNLFQENPEKYAPEYGGYCAYAMAEGKKVKIDPEQWAIIDDRLFLNYNNKSQNKWMDNKERLIEKADEKWDELFNKNNR